MRRIHLTILHNRIFSLPEDRAASVYGPNLYILQNMAASVRTGLPVGLQLILAAINAYKGNRLAIHANHSVQVPDLGFVFRESAHAEAHACNVRAHS